MPSQLKQGGRVNTEVLPLYYCQIFLLLQHVTMGNHKHQRTCDPVTSPHRVDRIDTPAKISLEDERGDAKKSLGDVGRNACNFRSTQFPSSLSLLEKVPNRDSNAHPIRRTRPFVAKKGPSMPNQRTPKRCCGSHFHLGSFGWHLQGDFVLFDLM